MPPLKERMRPLLHLLSLCIPPIYCRVYRSRALQKPVVLWHRNPTHQSASSCPSCLLTYSVYCALPLHGRVSLLLVILIVFLLATVSIFHPPTSPHTRCPAGPAIRASPLPVLPLHPHSHTPRSHIVSRPPPTSHCPHSLPFLLCFSPPSPLICCS